MWCCVFPFESFLGNAAFIYIVLASLSVAINKLTAPGFNPKGKHVLITGGSTGLGLAVAKKCAQAGAKVTIISRSERNLAAAKNEIQTAVPGSSVFTFACDVSNFETMATAVQAAKGFHNQSVHTLICSAGLAYPGFFHEQDISVFRDEMNLNYFGCVHAAKAVVDDMIANKSGHIVFVSSAAAFVGMVGYTQYCASKFAVRGLADCLRNELLPHKVRVTIYYPANIKSPGFEQEERTKPAVTKAIEGTGSLCTPESAADSLISGIKAGDYAITNDFGAGLLRMGVSGCTPRSNLLIELALLPLVGLIGAGFTFFMDYTVRTHKKKTN
eukprot:Colp12_sorted_trinity150504_noHs@19527